MEGDEPEQDDEAKQADETERATSIGQLHERLQLKLAELRGANYGQGKKSKKPKLSKAEKRQKAKMEKRLKNKMTKIDRVNGSESPSQNPTAKPVYRNDGKMVFSKFDFANAEMAGTKASGNDKKHLDPKSALNKIKKHKEKLESLEAIGT